MPGPSTPLAPKAGLVLELEFCVWAELPVVPAAAGAGGELGGAVAVGSAEGTYRLEDAVASLLLCDCVTVELGRVAATSEACGRARCEACLTRCLGGMVCTRPARSAVREVGVPAWADRIGGLAIADEGCVCPGGFGFAPEAVSTTIDATAAIARLTEPARMLSLASRRGG